MNRNTIITGVIALIVGLIIGWLIGHGAVTNKTAMNDNNLSANADSSMTDDETAGDDSMIDDDAMMTDSDAAVMVSDQEAGSTVTVASVENDHVTWVAVRESNNGALGNILGAARIEAGTSNNIVVSLLRPTMAGKDYFVVLFNDNGDRVFDHKVDMAVTSGGTPVSQTFKTL